MPAPPKAPPQGPDRNACHPSGDDRFKLLDTTLRRHHNAPDALIEVLHTAQEVFGFLGPDVLAYVARAMKLPPSRVHGVATFYHFFSLEPRGDHTCMVCLGTACYVKGADEVLQAARRFAAGAVGCGTISVETARCVGACGLAPVALLDGQVHGTTTPDALVGLMKGWQRDGAS
jgi:bidirectional [NiFe] hydrogenase diaphorase subunit